MAPFENEPAMQRLVLLLLLATTPEVLPAHLAGLDRELLGHPVVFAAVQACCALAAGHGTTRAELWDEIPVAFLGLVPKSAV